ncbi:MAG: sensor histidine kinase [Streptosporangiales bacterium]|nr:sensor histidine kinase [Streptosporangiales bacterium]
MTATNIAAGAAAPAAKRPGFLRRAALDTGYCLGGFPVALARFIALIPLFVLGVSLAVAYVGLPILVLTLYVARGFADIERLRLRTVLRRPVQRPRYKSREDRQGLRRLLTPMTEAQSWLDFLYGVLALVPATVTFVVAVTWWVGGIGGSLYVLWGWSLPSNDGGLAYLLGLGDSYVAEVAAETAAGLLLLVTAPFVVRGLASMNAAIARMMLTRERVTALQERIEELAGSRDAAVSAEASALRKLERDIHDGPQQRLTRLALDLSLAQRKMRTDPEAAQPLLTEAISQTRETLDELRALSRGIAPPILVDRGLQDALAALAGRSTVPVELDVSLPDRHRLPERVEATFYFLVAESLTNVAKHSGASRCQVRVSEDGTLAYVTISDDGNGGAHVSKGHGLAGLADRVRAADGHFDLHSPPGGPTVVMAKLPCA